MEFTPEQIEYFRRKIEEAHEMQRRFGNKTYSEEEIEAMLEITPEEIKEVEKLRAEKIRNGEKIYTEEEIYEMFGIEDIPEELVISLQEEESGYNRN